MKFETLGLTFGSAPYESSKSPKQEAHMFRASGLGRPNCKGPDVELQGGRYTTAVPGVGGVMRL